MKNEVDESIYTRVTTPLKKFSGSDSVPCNILDYASDRGTRVHQYCELYANNMLFGDIDDDCIDYVQAFVNFFDEHVNHVYSTEKRFFCDNKKIQGQVDMIANVKDCDGITLIDIKTSLKKSKTWNLQLAAYKYLARENKVKVNNSLVVQLKKDGTYEIHLLDIEKYQSEIQLYTYALKLYRYFS